MPNELPGSSLDNQARKPPQAPISPEEMAAIAENNAHQQSQIAEAEKPEDRKAELATLVMDHWEAEGGQNKCFGVPVQAEMVPDKVVDCLVIIEADYEINLDTSLENGELSPADIGNFLQTEIGHQANRKKAREKIVDLEAEESEILKKEETKEGYESFLKSEKFQKASNTEKISMMASFPGLPERERAKLQAFQSILSIAETVPQDSQIITGRLNQADFSKGVPDPVQFVRWAVFSSDGHESGVSETSQNAIATSLGIARNDIHIRSRDDMYRAWKDGAGTETYLDANGNEQTRKIPLTRDNMAEITPGQYLYEDASGANVMRVELANGKFLEAEFTETNNVDAEDYGRTMQIMGLLAASNMLKPIYKRGVRLEAGGRIPIDPVDIRTTEKITQVFADVFAGQDDQLFSPEQLARMEHVLQVHSPKGDYEQQDRDPDAMEAHLKAQGILDQNGDVNWQRWKEIVDQERDATYSGARDFSLYQKAA